MSSSGQSGSSGSNQSGGYSGSSQAFTGLAPHEKQWVKENYGSEFHFLMSFGLKIHKDEDRTDGQHIAQTMANDDQSDEQPGK